MSADNVFSRARDSFRRYGFKTMSRIATPNMVRQIVIDMALRRLAAPTVAAFLRAEAELQIEPSAFILSLLPESSESIQTVLAECEALEEEINARYGRLSPNGSYRREWGANAGTAQILYATVRLLQPLVVLETGVANGHSTAVILEALKRNQIGKLTSIDVQPDVGFLLSDEEKAAWDFRLLPRKGRTAAFTEVVASLPAVDLFFHDSEHTYSWQSFEYRTIFPRLSSTAVLLSDDVDASYAFLDFCRAHNLQCVALFDRIRTLGGLRLPEKSRAE